MFNKVQLVMIGKALVQAEKSASRLAARDGQPESVAAEYRKFGADVGDLIKFVNIELVKMDAAKK